MMSVLVHQSSLIRQSSLSIYGISLERRILILQATQLSIQCSFLFLR